MDEQVGVRIWTPAVIKVSAIIARGFVTLALDDLYNIAWIPEFEWLREYQSNIHAGAQKTHDVPNAGGKENVYLTR